MPFLRVREVGIVTSKGLCTVVWGISIVFSDLAGFFAMVLCNDMTVIIPAEWREGLLTSCP